MPVVGMDAFRTALRKEAAAVPVMVTALQKHALADAFGMLATPRDELGSPPFGSPRLTGRFIASLRVSVGSPDTSYEPELSQHPVHGDQPLYPLPDEQDAMNRLAGLQAFQRVMVTQSVPYARDIEGGFSRKTPRGVFLNTYTTFAAAAQSYKIATIARPSGEAPF